MPAGSRFTLEVEGLPPDALVVASFHLKQSLSSLFTLDISLVSQQFLSIDFSQVLEKTAHLKIWQGDEIQRRVNDIVTWFEQGENDGHQMLYNRFRSISLDKASRLKSSTTLSIQKRRPQARASCIKSTDQLWFSAAGVATGMIPVRERGADVWKFSYRWLPPQIIGGRQG